MIADPAELQKTTVAANPAEVITYQVEMQTKRGQFAARNCPHLQVASHML